MIIRIENSELFVGLSEAEAVKRVTEHGYEARVIHRDQWTATLIKDYDPLRVKLSVDSNKVVKAEIG